MQEEWKRWNQLDSLKLYEAIMLQKGIFPPFDHDQLSPEQESKHHNEIDALIKFHAEFKRLFSSLCADKHVGSEWRAKASVMHAAYSTISRATFMYHWRKCNFPVNKNFTDGKKGRPSKAEDEEAINFARQMKKENKSYKDFKHAACKKFECVDSTISGKVKRSHYDEL